MNSSTFDQSYFATVMSFLDTSPLAINVWSIKFENIAFNKKSVELFKIKDQSPYLADFFKLSPEFQPTGQSSYEQAKIQMHETLKSGYSSFQWLFIDVEGKELPAQVKLVKTEPLPNGEEYILSYISPMNEELIEADLVNSVENSFHDELSDKVLFNTLLDFIEDLIFTLDLRTMRFRYFGRAVKYFKVDKERSLEEVIGSSTIFHDDKEIFKQAVGKMFAGIVEPLEIRLIDSSGSVKYHRITYNLTFDSSNTPIFVIGRVEDIDEQKILEVQAKTDLLSGCLNKVSAENEIKSCLSQSLPIDQHSLFIIDVDNFKSINDDLGHHFGDLVIREIGAAIRKCFRANDIVGRLGGDEFVAFMKNFAEVNMVIAKAEKLIELFHKAYSIEKNEHPISGSIGIARYPLDGETYEDLYKAADKALYQSKKRGKDCFTFYSSEFSEGTMKNFTILENASRNENSYFDADLISMIFNLLYETKDISSTVTLVLRLLGIQYKVDRAYVFETLDSGKSYSNTYEWCAEGINPEIDNLQDLPAEILADFFLEASEDGIFFSNDLRVLEAEGAYELMANQGILSFLHAQVRHEDTVNLFLGFDDCTGPRIWSEREIITIKYIAKLLSTFLLLERAKT